MKKVFKTIALVAVIAATYQAGHYYGSHEFYHSLDGETIAYDKDQLLAGERRFCGAALDLLHKFYGNDDNEFWFDVVQNLPEYKAMEEANGGDWEDFYYWQELPLNAENYYNINGEIYIAD